MTRRLGGESWPSICNLLGSDGTQVIRGIRRAKKRGHRSHSDQGPVNSPVVNSSQCSSDNMDPDRDNKTDRCANSADTVTVAAPSKQYHVDSVSPEMISESTDYCGERKNNHWNQAGKSVGSGDEAAEEENQSLDVGDIDASESDRYRANESLIPLVSLAARSTASTESEEAGVPTTGNHHQQSSACGHVGDEEEGYAVVSQGVPQFPVYRCGPSGCTCNVRPCCLCHAVIACRRHTASGCARYQSYVTAFVGCVSLTAAMVYLGFAFHHSFGDEASLRLLGLALLLAAVCLHGKCRGAKPVRFAKRIGRELRNFARKHTTALSRAAVVTAMTVVCYFLLVEVAPSRPQHLTSALGVLVYVLLFYVTSQDPAQVRWRTVGWGLVLQFMLSLLVLRTAVGMAAVDWAGDRVQEYLAYTSFGTTYVFGEAFSQHPFAFKVLPSVVFFGVTMSVMRHYGLLQGAVGVASRLLTFTLGTGTWESAHAALSVFMGWTETLMVVRPALDQMSAAELHAVLTTSFATVSGSTALVFLHFGVPVNYLIPAALMSAPASLALSKLSYPDAPQDRKRALQRPFPTHQQEAGFIEAIISGARSSAVVVGYILANVFAFMCVLAFLNDVTFWLAERVGMEVEEDSIQVMCSYVFWPFAFLMGVPRAECGIVGRMLGLKLLLSELPALADLSAVRSNGRLLRDHLHLNNGSVLWDASSGDVTLLGTNHSTLNHTLTGGVLSPRSETIATFALCGFSDIYAYCVLLAAVVSAAPSRKNDLVAVSLRAWLTGITAGLLSASMAGLMSID